MSITLCWHEGMDALSKEERHGLVSLGRLYVI
jgi:hypothetical protein